MTKRIGAEQECRPSTHIEETLLDLVRWHDSNRRYKALVRCVGVRPSNDFHHDRPAAIDLLVIVPAHARDPRHPISSPTSARALHTTNPRAAKPIKFGTAETYQLVLVSLGIGISYGGPISLL